MVASLIQTTKGCHAGGFCSTDCTLFLNGFRSLMFLGYKVGSGQPGCNQSIKVCNSSIFNPIHRLPAAVLGQLINDRIPTPFDKAISLRMICRNTGPFDPVMIQQVFCEAEIFSSTIENNELWTSLPTKNVILYEFGDTLGICSLPSTHILSSKSKAIFGRRHVHVSQLSPRPLNSTSGHWFLLSNP